MKCRIFTLLFAFLAIAGNAVWGQNGSAESPVTIDISFMRTGGATTLPTGDGFTATKGTTSGTGDSDQSNTLTITGGGYYKLTGGNSNIQIKVTATEPVYITLASGIHVDASLDNDLTNPLQDRTAGIWENRCAMEIASGANVTLDWEGNCELSSGGLRAGINVKPNAILILKGTGSGKLYGTCWNNQNGIYTSGAGIGGDSEEPNFGTIIIENGTVEGRCLAQVSNWKAYGAGIGGGFKQGTPDPVENSTSSTSGTIIIKEGNVTGTANYDNTSLNIHTTGRSAAIGGGYAGTCTNIAILGGTINVTTGDNADDIGVGEDYDEGITNGIIIGKWDEKTNAPIIKTTNNENVTINNVNLADGRGDEPSITGTVTMPAKAQVYVQYGWGDISNIKSYNINLIKTSLAEDAEGSHISGGSTTNYEYYYYGPGQSFTANDLTCNDGHLFLGWYKDDDHLVASNGSFSTFTMPNEVPTSTIPENYYAVWVDNDYTIVVPSGKTWSADDSPVISTAGGDGDYLNSLKFSFDDEQEKTTYTSMTGGLFTTGNLSFQDNKLLGTPTLSEGFNYLQEDIDAYVKLGENGIWKTLKIHIRCAENIVIDGISVSSNTHVYDGKPHNGLTEYRGDDNDHLLKVTMNADWGDSEVTESNLKEGTHYRISSYECDGNTTTAEDESTALITNAGTYSKVTVEAKDGVTFSSSLDNEGHNTYTITSPIVVSKRPMNIDISLPKLEEGKTPTWADLKVDIEKPNNNNRGLVDGEDINVSGDVAYTLNEEGTEATITVSNIQIVAASSNNFKESNYEIEVNDDAYTDQLTITLTVPISPKEEDDNDRPGHIDRPAKYYNIYIDTVCPGLKLELSKDVVKEGGQVSVYLTAEEQCDTTGFAFEYKRGLFGRWEDLKPLEGVQPGEYIIKHIYTDIYIRALDAIVEEEEEPTGIEDVEGAKVYAQDGNIYVYTPNRERVMIVSMNGALVKNAEQEGMQSYSVSRGIYIVRIGDKVFKIKN